MENHFALEKLTSTNLTPLVSGDVLESWDFLLHFREKLSLQNGLSLEELITGLNEPFFHGLSKAHIRMLQELINEFPKESKHGRISCLRCSTECTMAELNIPPLNDLTWTELAKRYMLAMLFVTEDPNNSDKACARMDIFQCLCGDGGPKCGALTGLVELEEDALLLTASTKRIYGSLNGDMLAVDDLDSDKNTGLGQSTVLNERIPGGVQDLELIKGLKTDNGAKIIFFINDSLKKNPEKWAINILNHSISNEVYKGNASGPTKKLALHDVAEFYARQNLIPGRNKKKHICISDVVMKYCRILLRLVCASEKITSFCKFVELANNNEEGIFGSPAKVSSLLYFRMIDMRLVAGAYCGSHDAFIEDVREFWRDVQIDFPKLSKNAKEAFDEFESSCIKEVVALYRKLNRYKKLESLSADSLNNIRNIVHRCDKKNPKAPWDEVICKVCGIDQHNKNVLLWDKCDAGYYHTHCLTPPLKRVPKGNWLCPRCVANKDVEDALLNATLISQSQEKKNGEFVSFIHSKLADLEVMVRGKDYWELNFHERTLLLKFLCNDMLDTKLVRRHWLECESHQQCSSIEGSVTTEFMGIDFNGKLYWKIDDDISPSIVVNYCTGVDPFANEDVLKKQYKRMALTLHPDKNKSVGADGAFKILSQAWSVLSDVDQRTADNSRFSNVSLLIRQLVAGILDRGLKGLLPTVHMFQGILVPLLLISIFSPETPQNQSPVINNIRLECGHPFKQYAPFIRPQTFWTTCDRCSMHYEYQKKYLNQNLLCRGCQQPFLATEIPHAPQVNNHSCQ